MDTKVITAIILGLLQLLTIIASMWTLFNKQQKDLDTKMNKRMDRLETKLNFNKRPLPMQKHEETKV